MHEHLRKEAFRSKISMAELIRTKLRLSMDAPEKRKTGKDPILQVAGICRGPILSTGIDESIYGG